MVGIRVAEMVDGRAFTRNSAKWGNSRVAPHRAKNIGCLVAVQGRAYNNIQRYLLISDALLS